MNTRNIPIPLRGDKSKKGTVSLQKRHWALRNDDGNGQKYKNTLLGRKFPPVPSTERASPSHGEFHGGNKCLPSLRTAACSIPENLQDSVVRWMIHDAEDGRRERPLTYRPVRSRQADSHGFRGRTGGGLGGSFRSHAGGPRATASTGPDRGDGRYDSRLVCWS